MSFLRSFLLILFLAGIVFTIPALADEVSVSNPDNSDTEQTYNPGQGYFKPIAERSRKFSLRVESDFFSRYVWHGLPSSKGPVWQPSLTFESHGMGINVWSNFVLSDEPNQGQFNEVDFTLYYDTRFRRLQIQPSITATVYPNDNPLSLNFSPNSFEGNLHLAYPLGPVQLFTNLNLGFINPGGSIFWDVGVNYQKNLPWHFALDTSALFGLGDARFNKAYIAPVGTEPNLLEMSLAFPWTPLKGFTVNPNMTLSTILGAPLRAALPESVILWGGLSLSYEY